jgi:hypothetical protein
MTTEPLSKKQRLGQGTGCLVLFGSIFLLAGLAAFYFLFVRPMSRYVAARSWIATPCTVLDSRVGESTSDDSTTYRVEISFAYSVGGGEYRSDTYDFFHDVYSSGYDGKAAVVERYPPQSRTLCYVDPEDPSQAVIDRSFKPFYLLGLLPLVFVGAGLAIVVWAVKASPARRASLPGSVPPPFGHPPPQKVEGPVELKPQWSPVGKFIGIVCVALFWNGIVSVFVWQAYQAWQGGQPDGCLTLFLVPFVLIGLVLLAGVCGQFLVLFNPRVKITLNRATLVPGEAALLQWRFAGRASRVRRLTITLEGVEEVRYRRGTDTHTDRSVFTTLPIANADQEFSIPQGSAVIRVPEDAIPSFEAANNKIVWSLKVCSEIGGWPDSEDVYVVLVRPEIV